MELVTILVQNVSSTSFFAMRPLLTSFAIALLARAAYDTNTASYLSMFAVENAAAASWLASDTVLGVLLLLAVLEFGANASSDLRFWYEGSSFVVQPGSSFFVSYGLVDSQSVYYFEMWMASLPPELLNGVASALHLGVAVASNGDAAASSVQVAEALSWIGHVLALGWAGLMAAGAWFIGRIRAGVLDLVFDLDEDDNIGAGSLLMWGEYGWAGVASYLIIILPLVGLALFGATLAGLWLVRRYFEHRERKSLVACGHCGNQMQPTALFCANCRTANPQPRQVGLFGQARKELATDPAVQRLQLIGRKRCPVCATRLKAKDTRQACPACATVTFGDIAQVNTFLRALDAKLPRTLMVSGLLGLVPLVGIVPAVIYYRLSLIASLRGYIPRSTGCLLRWGIRVINIVLIMLQPIPLLGALVVPIMCAISYSVHRQVVLQSATASLARTFDPPTVPAGVPAGVPVALVAPTIPLPPPAPAPVAATQNCRECGVALEGGYRFCTACGAPVERQG